MFKLSFQKQLVLGFALSLLIVIGVNFLSYRSIKEFDENAKLVNHTHEVLNVSNEVLNQLLNAETGQRGFLATGAERYLQFYNVGLVKIPETLNRLEGLISNNPRQVVRLDSLRLVVNAKIEELSETVKIRREKGLDAALKIVLTDRGRAHMLQARKIVNEINRAEEELKQAREARAAEGAENTIRNILLGMILVLAIIIFMIFYIVRTFKMQQEAEARVKRSNEQLEALSAENVRQNWMLTGSAALNEQLRGENEVVELCQSIITSLAHYIGAKIGSFYLYDNERDLLWRTGSYAHTDQGKYEQIRIGEGLVGQAAKELRSIIVEHVPDDYIKIGSSLGETKPANLLIAPFLFSGRLKGIIELGFTGAITATQSELIERVVENIAIAIQSAQARERMQKLLEQIQLQAEELETQQEELRQTNDELSRQTHLLQASEEELRVQQEELKQTNAELEEKASLLEEKNKVVEEARAAIITKAKELELTNKYKSEFLANMSHELRTPLNSILILAKLLGANKHGHLDAEEVKYANVVYNAGNDLLTLINDILDLSKIESGKLDLSFEQVPLKEISDDMFYLFNEMAANKKISFSLDIDPALPRTILTDKVRLEQVVRNLLSNAFKFTPEEGFIKVKFTPEAGKKLMISVIDTGIGIAEDKQKVIFEAFKQADGSTSRKYGGTGLGLSISRELAALLGGEIRLISAENEGSTFMLIVPYEYEAANANERIETVMHEAYQKPEIMLRTNISHAASVPEDDRRMIEERDKTLLVVEDDLYFAGILKDYAHKKGFKVVLAHNGKEALDFAREYKPDAIILDITLPVMNGWEVLKKLKTDPGMREIPVHVMSATDRNNTLLKTSGAISFTSKPVEKETLEEIFGRLQHELNPSHNKVLVIEDQQLQNDVMKNALSEQGFLVDQAFTGAEGLEKLRESEYDCVILDLKLPDMNGLDLLAAIKQEERYQSIPVIINTAMDLTPDMQGEILKHSNALVVKTQKSNARLMDEVKLFMNKIRYEAGIPKMAGAASTATLEKALAGKKILLVDDDMRNIFALSSSLQQYDLKVEIAANGVEALEKLAAGKDFDLVLMDIMMPEMDGYEAMRRIRQDQHYKNIPVIALTAKAMKNDREKCIEAGASDYIPKPVDMDKLLSMMRVWLSK